jgi:hypothetical protein
VDLAAWWADVVEAGGPRFGMIGGQPPAVAERIRAEYLRLAAPYAGEGFPVCAYLARATR